MLYIIFSCSSHNDQNIRPSSEKILENITFIYEGVDIITDYTRDNDNNLLQTTTYQYGGYITNSSFTYENGLPDKYFPTSNQPFSLYYQVIYDSNNVSQIYGINPSTNEIISKQVFTYTNEKLTEIIYLNFSQASNTFEVTNTLEFIYENNLVSKIICPEINTYVVFEYDNKINPFINYNNLDLTYLIYTTTENAWSNLNTYNNIIQQSTYELDSDTFISKKLWTYEYDECDFPVSATYTIYRTNSQEGPFNLQFNYNQ